MNTTTMREMEVIYFLDRNAYNVNDPNALIVEMEIMEEDDKVIAIADQEQVTLQIDMSDERLKTILAGDRKYLFATREEAQNHYNEELQKEVQAIHNKSKEDLLGEFFNRWIGNNNYDTDIVNAMREKIENEFQALV